MNVNNNNSIIHTQNNYEINQALPEVKALVSQIISGLKVDSSLAENQREEALGVIEQTASEIDKHGVSKASLNKVYETIKGIGSLSDLASKMFTLLS